MNSIQDGLIPFLQEAVSPFHAVQAAANRLRRAGFEELALGADWSLQPGRSYYVRAFGSSLLAFRLGKQPRRRLHLAAAHTDFPCLRVKPHPVLRTREYGTLNVEVYGGMIRSSWLDRPLSLAGKIVLEAEDVYRPEVRLVDLGRPVVTIPHLAIHMNRSVNEGETLNPQKDMLPLFALLPGCREARRKRMPSWIFWRRNAACCAAGSWPMSSRLIRRTRRACLARIRSFCRRPGWII